MEPTPLDVAITTYRRPAMVLEAIRSCTAQGEWLRRVVVVDDASGDDTAERVTALGDPRVSVYVRPSNGGIGAARRDAFARCTSEWAVLIDSDHELLPGALERLARLAAIAGPRVGIIGAQFRWDTGAVTPLILPEQPISYEERIVWSAKPGSIGSDYLLCVSRRVREQAQWATERSGMVDALFQLDAARVADAQFIPECLGYEKSDAPEGHSRGTVAHLLARRRKDAAGGVTLCRRIVERHGTALRVHGRPLLASVLREGAVSASLLGRRALATRWAIAAVSLGGPSVVAPGLVPACLMGGPVFSWAFKRSLVRGGAQP